MEQARKWLQSASSVVVLTGAGVSAESGVPTFRGPGGMWKQYRAEDLATPEAFERDPLLVWQWYEFRRTALEFAEPNPGHRALAELEKRTEHFTLVTQNVDGLHELAGSRNIVHLHGEHLDRPLHGMRARTARPDVCRCPKCRRCAKSAAACCGPA